jgi:hypothetical protein
LGINVLMSVEQDAESRVTSQAMTNDWVDRNAAV